MPIVTTPTTRISELADIEESIRGTEIRFGQDSVVDSFVKFKPAGGSGNVVIGDRVTINSGCVFYTGNGITICNDVAIAANCVFAPVNHAYESKDLLIRQQGFKSSRGGIVIEEDVWFGAGCVILDGVIVRRGAVVAAMSLVRGEVEEYLIVGGNPLRVLGRRI
jgi:virginiamycin A acetyltransferase